MEKTIDKVLKYCSLLSEIGKFVPKDYIEKINIFIKNLKTVSSTGTRVETELEVTLQKWKLFPVK